MSLILEGIDLPSKDQSPLLITVWADGVVCSVDSNGGIEETTSAIQIPKGHGRLIDEKEVILHHYETVYREVEHPKYQITPREMLDDAPTILEAEEQDG